MGNFSDKLSGEPAAEPARPLTFAQKLADDTPEPPGMFSSKLEEVEADYLATGGGPLDALKRGGLSLVTGTFSAAKELYSQGGDSPYAPQGTRVLHPFAPVLGGAIDKLEDVRGDIPRMPGLGGEFIETAPGIVPGIMGGVLIATGHPKLGMALYGTGGLRIYNEVHDATVQAGLNPRDAARAAVVPAIMGIASELIGGRGVARAMPKSGARVATHAVARLLQRLRGFRALQAFKSEGFTEAFQQANVGATRIGYDPNTDIMDPGVFIQLVKDIFKAFVFGGVLGTTASVFMDATGMTEKEFDEHVDESVDESWLERDVETLTFRTLEQDARAQVGFDTQDTIDAQLGIEVEQDAAPAAPRAAEGAEGAARPNPMDSLPEQIRDEPVTQRFREAADSGRYDVRVEILNMNYSDKPIVQAEVDANPANYRFVVHMEPKPAPHWKEHPSGRFVYDERISELVPTEKGFNRVTLKPDSGYSDSVPFEKDSGYIYRGVSYEEMQFILREGKIESTGSGSFESQQGQTSYTHDPATAGSYGGSFSSWDRKPSDGRPGYVIKVKTPESRLITDDPKTVVEGYEVGVRGPVSATEIESISEIRPLTNDPGEMEIVTADRFDSGSGWRTGSGTAPGGSSVFGKPQTFKEFVASAKAPTPARRSTPVGLSLDVQTHDTEGTQEIGPVWYSAAERAIKKWPQKKGTAVQIIAHLKKHGISDHEINWSGLGDFLRDNPDQVFTREKILSKLLAGQLRVEEELHEKIDGVDAADEFGNDIRRHEVSYGAYTYIETVTSGSMLSRTELGPSKQWELLVSLPDFEGELQAANYTDPHFSPTPAVGAGGANSDLTSIMFFLRMSERYIDGEEVLFIDEMQSDWHLNRRINEERELDLASVVEEEDAGKNPIPDVMSTTWTDAAVKRAIRFAAERGYKKVVFTNALASRGAVGISLQKAHNLYGKRVRNFARKFAKPYNSQVYDVGNLQTQPQAQLEQSAREYFGGLTVVRDSLELARMRGWDMNRVWVEELRDDPARQWDHGDSALPGNPLDASRAAAQRFDPVHPNTESGPDGTMSFSIFGREIAVKLLDTPVPVDGHLVEQFEGEWYPLAASFDPLELPHHQADNRGERGGRIDSTTTHSTMISWWAQAKTTATTKRPLHPDGDLTAINYPDLIAQVRQIKRHVNDLQLAAAKLRLSEEDLAAVETAEANPVDAMNSRSVFDQRGVDRAKNAALHSMGHDPASVAGMDPEAAAQTIRDTEMGDTDVGPAGEEILEKEHKNLVAELESYALPWAIDITPEMKEAALVGGVSTISPRPRGLPVGLSMAMWNDVTTTGVDPGTMNNQPSLGPAGESVDLLLDPARVAKNVAQFWYKPLLDSIDESGSATGRRVVESARRVVRISDGLFGQWQPMLTAYQRKLGREALRGKGAWQRWKDIQALMHAPRLGGRNYGESLFARAVENDELFDLLSDYQKEIVEGYREFVEVTGQEAERRGIHIMNGTESQPFRHTPGGRKFLRQFSEDYYQLLQQGESNPRVWNALLTALSEMNDLDHDVTLRQMKRMKAMALDRKQSFEVMRVFPRFPTHLWVPDGRGGESVVELMNSDPYTAATSLVRNAAYRMGFVDQFGQGHGLGLPADRRSSLELNVQLFADEGGDPKLMEQLFRTLNGLPRVMVEKIKVGTPAWRTLRGADYFVTARAGGALSTSYLPNMPETLAKLPAAVGARRLAKTYGMFLRGALTKRGRAQLAALRQELIRAGAVQPDVIKTTINPQHRSREISRFVSQVVTSPRRAVDDQNEFIAAAAGLAMAKDLQQGKGTLDDRDALVHLYHFSAADAEAMMDGTASQETYDALVREVVKWSQNTIASPSELSRMATGPVSSKAVRFDRFAQFTADRFLQLYRLAAPSLKGKGNAESRRHLKRLATFIAGSSLAGGIQVVMRAALWGGLVGLKDLWDDAEREPVDFIMEAFLAATFSGSLEALRSSTLGPRVTPLPMVAERLMYPLSTAGELYGVMSAVVFNVAPELGERGRGPYTGLKSLEAVSVFANRSLSMSGPIRYWASVAGIGDRSPEVLSATRSYYRWRAENVRGISISENRNERVEDVRFRAAMRRATKASIHGDMKGFVKHINEALGNVNDPQKVADSLRGRRFLPKIDKNKRFQFRQETLPEHYRTLELLDERLSALADIYQKLSPQPIPKERGFAERLLEQGAKLLSPKEAGAAGPQPRHGAFAQPQHTQAQVWAADGELVGQFTNADSARKGTNGLRNNNPGNLERSPDYFGKLKGAGYGDKKRFAIFDTMFHGIRAIGVDIRKKLDPLRDKSMGGQLHNIEQIIRAYAPGNENKTQEYIKKVEDWTGIPRGQQLSARSDKAQMRLLVAAIIRAENSFRVEPAILHRAVEDAWTPR